MHGSDVAVGPSKVLGYMVKCYDLISDLGAPRFLHDISVLIDPCQVSRDYEGRISVRAKGREGDGASCTKIGSMC